MKTERVCPISGLPFFMTIEHPDLKFVDTYGGPYDSYTVPRTDEDGNLYREKFDHDEGIWRDSESYHVSERACPECGGEGIDVKREIDGSLFGYKCQSCNGTGIKEREAGE